MRLNVIMLLTGVLFTVLSSFEAKASTLDLAHVKKLEGVYDLKVKIGQNIYEDVLVIEKVTQDSRNNRLYYLTGTFEVPGVFKANAKGSFFIDYSYSSLASLGLKFTAKERGEEFGVTLSSLIPKVFSQNFDEFDGVLKTSEDSQIFASFNAKKRD